MVRFCMFKSPELAIAEVSSLAGADPEQIGQRLLSHVEKLLQLRADIDKGTRSLDAGKGAHSPEARGSGACGWAWRRHVW